MAKRKKTRQEKIKADLRHQLPQTSLYVVETSTEKIQEIRPIVLENTSSQAHFVKDLQKTFYLTLAVLASQLALFFFLKNSFIRLPFINY